MSKDNFATPLTRFFRASACKATALHHLFQNKKLFNCLHKLSNGIDCAKNCPTRRNFAPNLHFPWFFNAKHKLSRFATVYVPARRLYEFDILRRFSLLNTRLTHNFFVPFHPQQSTKARTKTAESITQNSFEDNAYLQYFDETRQTLSDKHWRLKAVCVCCVRRLGKYVNIAPKGVHALKTAKLQLNFSVHFRPQQGNENTHKNSGKHHAKQFWRQCLPTILWRNTQTLSDKYCRLKAVCVCCVRRLGKYVNIAPNGVHALKTAK